MSRLRELVLDNPMTVEIKRFRNRFFSPGRMSTFNTLVLIMGALGFFIIVMIALTVPGFGAEAIMFCEMGVFCIVVPAVAHGSIAAEREKRTWDVLMTAPVTSAQVVMGKFIGAACAILAIWVLFWIPMALAYVNALLSTQNYNMFRTDPTAFWALLVGRIDNLLFALALAAFCILISARTKRAFGAFFISFGCIFFALVVLPLFLVATLTAILPGTFVNLATSWHPFLALTNLIGLGRSGPYGYGQPYDELQLDLFVKVVTVVSPSFFAIFFAVVFLMWAIKTVRFPDYDTRFLPRSKDAASH